MKHFVERPPTLESRAKQADGEVFFAEIFESVSLQKSFHVVLFPSAQGFDRPDELPISGFSQQLLEIGQFSTGQNKTKFFWPIVCIEAEGTYNPVNDPFLKIGIRALPRIQKDHDRPC